MRWPKNKKRRETEYGMEVNFYDAVQKRWVLRAFVKAGLELLSFERRADCSWKSFGAVCANVRTRGIVVLLAFWPNLAQS